MPNPDEAFQLAVADSRQLTTRPDNPTLLRMYALFKQASLVDERGERPPATDFVNRAKYDAWMSLDGLGQEQARTDYIALIDSLKE